MSPWSRGAVQALGLIRTNLLGSPVNDSGVQALGEAVLPRQGVQMPPSSPLAWLEAPGLVNDSEGDG